MIAHERTRDRISQEIHRDQFLKAAARSGLDSVAAERMWNEVGCASDAPPEQGSGLRRSDGTFSSATRLSRLVMVLLYVGAFLVIGSYGWWAATLHVGMAGLLALSLAYGMGFLVAAVWARARALDQLTSAASLITAFYVPVTVYAGLRLTGFRFHEGGVSAFYDWVSGGWIWLEIAAIVATALLYGLCRTALLGLPLSLFTLFLAMDGTSRFVGIDRHSSAHAIGAMVSAFACLAAAAGTLLDYHGLRRHALWPHIFAAIGTVTGLEYLLGTDSYQLALVLSGAVFLLVGIWLGRVAYLVAGGLALWIGITAYAPSPVLLTISGLGLVGTATWLSLANSPLRRWLHARTLPAPQRD